MSGAKVIKDDEQYEKARVAILDLADRLDDPLLLSDDERTRTMRIYDRTTDLMRFYRRGELVQLFPGLREQYKILGLEWQELGDPIQVEPELPAEKPLPPEPIPESEQPQQMPIKSKPNLMAWLDD
ncbi:hypothetical protein [Paenibacillus crassostreae]|uniref:Uncharacterized protein n=1 Tax=Paenibacillus crassostreae TaxID=1763538 RepID=A0A162KRP1_9BACL|nr:hypothetical protein [Paenibacillus crassostreae]AOZ91592.1 hypothetical protein LPB68_04760 [Paenibacillus crassostreae]OAB72833.1 hypothetical protein PNBC_15490 [Paenibacillus crassostreae]